MRSARAAGGPRGRVVGLATAGLLALAPLLEALLPAESEPPPLGLVGFAEAFEPELGRLRTLSALEAEVDAELARQGLDRGAHARVVRVADDLVRRRFHHGYTTFAPGESLLLGLLPDGDRLHAWTYHVKAKVLPEDILRSSHAACSQQAIVLHALLVRLGFRARGLAMRGHYTLEVLHAGRWRFLDPNLEVRYASPDELPVVEEVLDPVARRRYYAHLDPATVDQFMAEARPLLERPDLAPRLGVLQRTAKLVVSAGWLVPLVAVAIGLVRRRRPQALGSAPRWPSSISRATGSS